MGRRVWTPLQTTPQQLRDLYESYGVGNSLQIRRMSRWARWSTCTCVFSLCCIICEEIAHFLVVVSNPWVKDFLWLLLLLATFDFSSCSHYHYQRCTRMLREPNQTQLAILFLEKPQHSKVLGELSTVSFYFFPILQKYICCIITIKNYCINLIFGGKVGKYWENIVGQHFYLVEKCATFTTSFTKTYF